MFMLIAVYSERKIIMLEYLEKELNIEYTSRKVYGKWEKNNGGRIISFFRV